MTVVIAPLMLSLAICVALSVSFHVMPIVALSDSAARAISSTLVLNDAISVIKELIDNALDSNASNITIEISANTLDIIQVKDNGGGIGVEDRQLLCKRGFTSKIRTFEDLSQLGGTYLGFRGEALASIADLSESVTITTRIDGETVGTLLKFNSQGKLISSSSAAHGTGTTVRVVDFLKSIPVRKQTALKQATKTLNSIKKVLFDYAFARPTVRFQFKVLKSGNDLKANWSFAPCNDATNLNLLASKIVGKDVAAQCKQSSMASEDGGYMIDALLFAQEADIAKCGGTDRFISIDGRPLAVERGLIRDFNKVYKSYISSALPDGTSVPNKVFLLLRLRCPRGSYDVNIEPAKNEVMFEDSGLILDLFQRLCRTAYGERKPQEKTKKDSSNKQNDRSIDFNMLLSNKTPLSMTKEQPNSGLQSTDTPRKASGSQNHETTNIPSGNPKQTKVFNNMFDIDEEEMLALADEEIFQQESVVIEEAEDIMDPKATNPFVLAKLNTLLKPPKLLPTGSQVLTPGKDEGLSSVVSFGRDSSSPVGRSNLLPSPSPSPDRNVPYQNPGPPNRPWKTRQNREENDDEDEIQGIASARSVEPARPTLLDSWTTSINSSSPERELPNAIQVKRSEPIRVHTHTATGTFSNTSTKKMSGKRPAGLSSAQQSAFRTPFKKGSTLQGSSPISVDCSSDPQVARSIMQPVEPNTPDKIDSKFPGFERPRMPFDDELDEIMDFEHRKRNTVLEHRRKTKQAERGPASGVDDQSEEPAFSVPARPEKEGITPAGQEASYGSKFGGRQEASDDSDIPQQPNSASYTQNPHWNRYKKAVRDLDARRIERASAALDSNTNTQDDTDEDDDRVQKDGQGQRITMSPRDPRAYLIRQMKRKALQGDTDGLKKLSTAKLPFETIQAGLATYPFVQIMGPESIRDLKQMAYATEALNRVDSYVCMGTISSDIVEGTISKETSRRWEARLQELMSAVDSYQFEGLQKLDAIIDTKKDS